MRTFKSFAYIYLGSGEEQPERDRREIDVGGMKAIFVGVPNQEASLDVARNLVDEGVNAIDLCSAFDSDTLARITSIAQPFVAVGRTSFGLESVRALAMYQECDVPGNGGIRRAPLQLANVRTSVPVGGGEPTWPGAYASGQLACTRPTITYFG